MREANFKKLNFPKYNIKLQRGNNANEPIKVFDIARKKYVVLTPEEWVRQHVIHYLHFTLNYPLGFLSIERTIVINDLTRRYDIVVFNRLKVPALLVECKAPTVALNQAVADQASRYDASLKTSLFLITNGLQHLILKPNHLKANFEFLEHLPEFSHL
ncbi:MAG: hypothetical protein RIQ89_2222 [Bacteroidota bacterium]|jgi:hypothetical protein